MIPAPFSRFFHPKHAPSPLAGVVVFVSRQLCDGFACITRQLCGWFACITRQLCGWFDHGSAPESAERAGRSTFPTPSPALRERAGVRASPNHPTHQALLWSALWQCANSLYRSTSSMQASGVHGIRPIIGNFDRFTASAALNSVFAASTTTTSSQQEPARYVLRSG